MKLKILCRQKKKSQAEHNNMPYAFFYKKFKNNLIAWEIKAVFVCERRILLEGVMKEPGKDGCSAYPDCGGTGYTYY